MKGIRQTRLAGSSALQSTDTVGNQRPPPRREPLAELPTKLLNKRAGRAGAAAAARAAGPRCPRTTRATSGHRRGGHQWPSRQRCARTRGTGAVGRQPPRGGRGSTHYARQNDSLCHGKPRSLCGKTDGIMLAQQGSLCSRGKRPGLDTVTKSDPARAHNEGSLCLQNGGHYARSLCHAPAVIMTPNKSQNGVQNHWSSPAPEAHHYTVAVRQRVPNACTSLLRWEIMKFMPEFSK